VWWMEVPDERTVVLCGEAIVVSTPSLHRLPAFFSVRLCTNLDGHQEKGNLLARASDG
jgi:hypothetical protein